MLAKKHHKESKRLKLELDATMLTFENQEFDMVLSFFVLHHIGSSWDKALTEINRVLKPGGYFIFYNVAFSGFATRMFRGHIKKFDVYTIDDIITVLKTNKIESVYKEKPHGAIWKHHAAVFQKKS